MVAPEHLRQVFNRIAQQHAASLQSLKMNLHFEPTTWGERGVSRNQGYRRAKGDWVYFLDQDVRLPNDRQCERMHRFLMALSQVTNHQEIECIVAGRYLNADSCSFWGRRYNWLANLWLENAKYDVRFLAGNFAIHKKSFLNQEPLKEALFDSEISSGGEEIALSAKAHAHGKQSRIDPDLALEHLADHTFWRLWSRLWSHACFKQKSKLVTKKTRTNLYVLSRVLFAPVEWLGVAVLCLTSLLAPIKVFFFEEIPFRGKHLPTPSYSQRKTV